MVADRNQQRDVAEHARGIDLVRVVGRTSKLDTRRSAPVPDPDVHDLPEIVLILFFT